MRPRVADATKSTGLPSGATLEPFGVAKLTPTHPGTQIVSFAMLIVEPGLAPPAPSRNGTSRRNIGSRERTPNLTHAFRNVGGRTVSSVIPSRMPTPSAASPSKRAITTSLSDAVRL
jgi:hypothetical protein